MEIWLKTEKESVARMIESTVFQLYNVGSLKITNHQDQKF